MWFVVFLHCAGARQCLLLQCAETSPALPAILFWRGMPFSVLLHCLDARPFATRRQPGITVRKGLAARDLFSAAVMAQRGCTDL